MGQFKVGLKDAYRRAQRAESTHLWPSELATEAQRESDIYTFFLFTT